MEVVLAGMALAGTLAGVLLGHRLSYHRFNKEKLWELRQKAYSKILSELSALELTCEGIDSYVTLHGFQTYWQDETRPNIDNQMLDRRQIVRGAISDNYIILSDEFIEICNKFADEAVTNPFDTDPQESYEAFSKALRKYRPQLQEIARNEMGLKPRRWWPF